MSITEAIMNFIFPPRCPLCSASVTRGGGWCRDCVIESLDFHELHLPDVIVYSLTSYHSFLGDVLRSYKLNLRLNRVRHLEGFNYQALTTDYVKEHIDSDALILPVPLHPEKLKQRGFNQVVQIFQRPFQEHGYNWQEIAIRTKKTKPMYELKGDDRKVNVEGAFELVGSVKGKSVVIVDDIITTGSTISELARLVLANGAAKVTGFTLTFD